MIERVWDSCKRPPLTLYFAQDIDSVTDPGGYEYCEELRVALEYGPNEHLILQKMWQVHKQGHAATRQHLIDEKVTLNPGKPRLPGEAIAIADWVGLTCSLLDIPNHDPPESPTR